MNWLGLGKRTQLPEHWTAALGALLAVLAVFLASGWALGEENLVVATSMGFPLSCCSPHRTALCHNLGLSWVGMSWRRQSVWRVHRF